MKNINTKEENHSVCTKYQELRDEFREAGKQNDNKKLNYKWETWSNETDFRRTVTILLPVTLFLLYYYTLPIMTLLGYELFALNEEKNKNHSISKTFPLMGLAGMI